MRGAEGRHAAVVRRIGVGEEIMVGDGQGRVVYGTVVDADGSGIAVRVDDLVDAPADPSPVTVVQALAKGDRAELAVELMTEVGVGTIRPWFASRCIVKWKGDRGTKALEKWRSTAREATKQSRRAWVPQVTEPVTTKELCASFAEDQQVLVLHESAEQNIGEIEVTEGRETVLIVGPEGGITDEELAAFIAAGATAVRVSDGVLRTSTAGAIGAGILRARDDGAKMRGSSHGERREG